jgi:hypothetical protein
MADEDILQMRCAMNETVDSAMCPERPQPVQGNGLCIVVVAAKHHAEIDHRVDVLWIQSDGPVIMLPCEPCSALVGQSWS